MGYRLETRKEIDHQDQYVGCIRMDLGGRGCGLMENIDRNQDSAQWRAVLNTAMDLWVP
jgi:hypothetical protein